MTIVTVGCHWWDCVALFRNVRGFGASETPTSTAMRCRSSARHREIWSRRWQLCPLIMELYMRWWPLLVQWSYVRAPVTCYQSRTNCLALWRVLDSGQLQDLQEICPFTGMQQCIYVMVDFRSTPRECWGLVVRLAAGTGNLLNLRLRHCQMHFESFIKVGVCEART